MPDLVSVLAEECRRVAGLLYRSLFQIPTVLDEGPPAEPDTDSVTYWRSYDPPTDAPLIATHAQETAAEYDSGHALAVAFDDLCRGAVERARGEDPGRLVRVWWGPKLRLDDFLTTRVLEVVVHGLDTTHA